MGVITQGKLFKSDHSKWTTRQSIVEFVLVLPILLLIIITSLELGRVFMAKIVLTNAAREGAYYLTTHSTDNTNCSGSGSSKVCYLTTRSAILAEANNSGLALTNSNITVPASCCTVGQSTTITVSTSVNNVLILSLVNKFAGIKAQKNTFPISSSVTMVMQ